MAGRDALLDAFDEFLAERPLHANWALTGLRGTGKTVLLGEFAARRTRRLAHPPARVTVGEVGYEPAYADRSAAPAEQMRQALSELDAAAGDARPRGVLRLYEEAHRAPRGATFYFGAYVCRSAARPQITVADFRAVESSLLHELDLAFFDDRFEGARPTEQRFLEAMAREPGQIRLTRLRPRLGDVASLDLVIRRLVERGLIFRAARDTYDFALPLFRAYIRRRQANLSNVSGSARSAACRRGPGGDGG